MESLHTHASFLRLASSENYLRNQRLHLKHKLALVHLLVGFDGLGNNLGVLLGGIPGAQFLVIAGATIIQI